MSTDYPAQILNHDGSEIELEGRVNFTDPANAPGGSQPVQANYSGAAVTIADGAGSALPFTTLDSGTDLLDRSIVTAPVVLAAGTYALTLKVFGDALTAGGFVLVRGTAGSIFNATSEHPDYGMGPPTVVAVLAQGEGVACSVTNEDGAASRDFYIDTAILVKLA